MSDRIPPPIPDWIGHMLVPGTSRRMVEVGDSLAMHVMELGRGTPVLMLHGNPTWSFLWRRVAAELDGAGLHLVMPDLIGLGLSDRPARTADHTLEAHARWLTALVEALALERLVLVAQDWGGPIGLLAMAELHGRAGGPRLAGLVLMNTVASPPRPGFRPSAFHRFARMPVVSDVAFRLLGFPQRWLHTTQGDRRSISGDVARAYRWPLAGGRGNAAPLAMARMVPHDPAHPSVAALARCQGFVEASSRAGVPAALVWGTKDPILGRVVSWMEKLLPDAPVTRTEAGHFLQEEVPREIAMAVKDVAVRAQARSSGS